MKFWETKTKGQDLAEKLNNGYELTKEDMEVVKDILNNPLEETIKREALFRLSDVFELANEYYDEELAKEVEDVIGTLINQDGDLYDTIDKRIQEILQCRAIIKEEKRLDAKEEYESTAFERARERQYDEEE